jgi:hypothetical protein
VRSLFHRRGNGLHECPGVSHHHHQRGDESCIDKVLALPTLFVIIPATESLTSGERIHRRAEKWEVQTYLAFLGVFRRRK